jgi:hypothetical protein
MSAFRFVLAPTIASLTPATGDVSGGTVVRVSGSGFGANATVTFGGTRSPLVTLVNDTTLDVVAPAHAPGPVDVVLTSADGSSATLSAGFQYTRAAPTITAIAPASGTTAGGTLVAISGAGFTPTVTVTFGGTPATDVVTIAGVVRARTPAHAEGAVDLVVTNDDGQSGMVAAGFTFTRPPDGQTGVVNDGGSGTLGDPPDGGGTPSPPTGCGCSQVDVAVLFAALGLLARRRKA